MSFNPNRLYRMSTRLSHYGGNNSNGESTIENKLWYLELFVSLLIAIIIFAVNGIILSNDSPDKTSALNISDYIVSEDGQKVTISLENAIIPLSQGDVYKEMDMPTYSDSFNEVISSVSETKDGACKLIKCIFIGTPTDIKPISVSIDDNDKYICIKSQDESYKLILKKQKKTNEWVKPNWFDKTWFKILHPIL